MIERALPLAFTRRNSQRPAMLAASGKKSVKQKSLFRVGVGRNQARGPSDNPV
jgi:hypothetical protein